MVEKIVSIVILAVMTSVFIYLLYVTESLFIIPIFIGIVTVLFLVSWAFYVLLYKYKK